MDLATIATTDETATAVQLSACDGAVEASAGPQAPLSEPDLFAALTTADRERSLGLAGILEEFDRQPVRSACVREFAARAGYSQQRFYGLYYAWRKAGLAALAGKRAVKRASQRCRRTALSPEFIAWFRGLLEEHNTESVPQARRVFLQRLRRGERIPGLGTWRELWAARYPGVPPPASAGAEYPRGNVDALLPAGYSVRSLLHWRGELLERVAARQGTFAAHRYAPQVLTTRVGLAPGQILMADDVWHNQLVNYMGSPKALRPIELCMFDVASAHKIAWGMRPRVFNPQTGRHEGIREHEFRLLLAYWATEIGYRPQGTELWLERGTAAVDDDLADALHRLSNRCVTVRRAPLKDARQVCSVYRSVASGNPSFKAPLEAHHSIAHTALSAIAGQVGRDRDVEPEEIAGRKRENELLLKLAAVLPPELASRLVLPVLQWEEYAECVITAYDELAWRTWHTLEGWEAARNFRHVAQIPPFTEPLPLDLLQDSHPDVAAAVLAAVREHPEWARTQPLSPIEVWQRGAGGLVKFQRSAAPLIMGARNGFVRAAPQEWQIRVASRELGPAPHIYTREYVDARGAGQRMEPGRQYLFHVNPFSTSRELYVSTPEGGYLGVAARIAVPCRADHDAVLDRIKAKRRAWAEIAARVSGRHLTTLARQAVASAANAALIGAAADAGLLPARAGSAEGSATQAVEPAQAADTAEADAAIYEMYGAGSEGK